MHIKNIRTVIRDHYVCCIEDTNLMLHGFCHTLYFWNNAVHISRWIIPPLKLTKKGFPKPPSEADGTGQCQSRDIELGVFNSLLQFLCS